MEAIRIYQNGRPAGTLRRRQEGLYTVFEAALPRGGTAAEEPGALTRLYVCGGGRRFCLGVMEPRPAGLYLCRRFSRAALARLPAPLEYAAADDVPPVPQQTPDATGPAPRILVLDGVRYLALPCALRRPTPGLRLYSLAGRQYLLFRT